jgi:hypothetical protein
MAACIRRVDPFSVERKKKEMEIDSAGKTTIVKNKIKAVQIWLQ